MGDKPRLKSHKQTGVVFFFVFFLSNNQKSALSFCGTVQRSFKDQYRDRHILASFLPFSLSHFDKSCSPFHLIYKLLYLSFLISFSLSLSLLTENRLILNKVYL